MALLARVLAVVLVCASAGALAGDCPADCNDDREVRLTELINAVNVALHPDALELCCAADADGSGTVTVDELIAAVERSLFGCPTPSPTASADPSPTPTPGLGARRFSIEAASSPLVAVLAPDAVVFNLPGFAGFLELTAGEPDSETGLASVDVTDASEFVAIDIPAQPAALCLRPVREALPVVRAGILSCAGGFSAELVVSQDHRLGEIGRCAAGGADGEPCESDADCAGGTCFDEADCAAAGGSVEQTAQPHPGVCNGPLTVRRGAPAASAGALLIARDPELDTRGLPVEILMEESTPCGDEAAPGMSSEIGLSTAGSRIRVLAYNADPDATLEYLAGGETFSCQAWRTENGPGILVFAGISLDVPALPGAVTDLATAFVWDD